MKKFLLLIALCIPGQLFCQDPDPELFRLWYLRELTVSGEVFLPTDYGFYPDITLTDFSGFYEIGFADPLNVLCTSGLVFSETQPEQIFEVLEGTLCFPDQTCNGNPTGPCTTMYGTHSNFYYDTVKLPLTYEITPTQNDILSLTVTNNNGDIAYYESEPILAIEDFNTTALNVYPNPASDQLFVSDLSTPAYAISIFSLEGKLLLASKNAQKIDMASLPSGLYLVQIVVDGKASFKKVIKN